MFDEVQMTSMQSNVTATALYWDQLPKVVVAHATFQRAISGDPSESALAYPIQVYLGVKSGLKEIVAEKDHPSFQTGKVGRNRQIDFVGINPKGRWSFGLEMKIFEGGKRGRVIQDLVKLQLLSERTDGACMLLLLFKRTGSDGPANFEFDETNRTATHAVWNRKGESPTDLFKELLLWEQGRKTIRIPMLSSQLRKEFLEAIKELKVESVPETFDIKRVGYDWSDDFVCGLWQLYRAPGAKKRFGAADMSDEQDNEK
jgi:hypothetical protein